MKHTMGYINEETGCNDRECLEASQNDWERSRNSININEYSEGLKVDSPEPQRFIYPERREDNQKENDMSLVKKLIEVLTDNATLSVQSDKLSGKENFELKSKWLRDNLPNLPDTLIPITVGALDSGDDDNEITDEIPPWLDRAKFARGQQFARDYLFGIFFAEVMSLYTLFSFEDGLKPLIVTGKSAEPYTAFTRYLSTANRVRNWYTSDPWTKGTTAYNDIRVVRQMHRHARRKLSSLTIEHGNDDSGVIDKPWAVSRDVLIEDFRFSCPAAGPGQCPYSMGVKLHIKRNALSQGDMAATQFGFFGLIILFPEAFGIHSATDEDLEAFCHVWKGIGFLLGIKDEFNFCLGSLDLVRKRARDFLDFWVKPNLRDITPEWEHMMRCISAGLQYYFPGAPFEASLFFLTELLGLEMKRFHSSLSFNIKMRHNLTKLIMKYPYKITSFRELLNSRLHRAMDRALKFDDEKHAQLREKSAKTMSMVSEHGDDINIKTDGDDKSPINVAKYSQYKIIGVLMVITQCLILWRVTLTSGLL